jgi:drug/metabolite transporter (DMT)-like permease
MQLSQEAMGKGMGRLAGEKITGVLLVGIAVLAWAILPIGLKSLTITLADEQIVFARFFVAVVVLAPFAFGSRRNREAHLDAVRLHWKALLALAIVGIVLPQLLFTWAVRNLPIGIASFLAFSHPVFSILLAAALLRERKLGPWGLLVTSVLLVAGLVLLSLKDPRIWRLEALQGWLSGPFLIGLGVPLLWGLSSVLAKVLLKRQVAPPMVLAWWRIAAGTAFVGVVVAARGGMNTSFITNLSLDSALWLAVLGVLSVAVGISAYFAGLERVTLTTASALEACVAPLGAILAMVFLPEERLLAHQWVGGGVVFLAALVPAVASWLKGNGSQADRKVRIDTTVSDGPQVLHDEDGSSISMLDQTTIKNR